VRGDEDEFDLRAHIESSGHQLELCPHVIVTRTAARGFLSKLGSRFHNWNKRWFVFDRETRTLHYYSDKNEKKSKPRGGVHFEVGASCQCTSIIVEIRSIFYQYIIHDTYLCYLDMNNCNPNWRHQAIHPPLHYPHAAECKTVKETRVDILLFYPVNKRSSEFPIYITL